MKEHPWFLEKDKYDIYNYGYGILHVNVFASWWTRAPGVNRSLKMEFISCGSNSKEVFERGTNFLIDRAIAVEGKIPKNYNQPKHHFYVKMNPLVDTFLRTFWDNDDELDSKFEDFVFEGLPESSRSESYERDVEYWDNILSERSCSTYKHGDLIGAVRMSDIDKSGIQSITVFEESEKLESYLDFVLG